MGKKEFETLYKEYKEKLMYFIHNTTGHDLQSTEDIFQNTMIKAYKYIHTLKEKDKCYAWLRTIAWNEAMSYHKKVSKDNFKHLFDDENNNGIYEELIEPDFSVEYISSEVFLGLLNKLSPNEQSILILHYVHGYKLTEIAEVRNVNKNTIKSIYRRGLQKIEKYME